jgi:methyl-accepting chemotaxis protein
MNLSVIHRISGGYVLILLCLISVAVVGVIGLNSINSNLQTIEQKATPIREITASLNAELAAANLAMYQHFNSSNVSDLNKHEDRFAHFRTKFHELTSSLMNKLKSVEGSDSEVQRLITISESAPKVFDDIELLMKLYRNSFSGVSRLTQLQSNVDSREQALLAVFKEIEKFHLTKEESLALHELQLQVKAVYSIGLAKQLILVNNLDAYNSLAQSFNVWLKEYVAFGYILMGVKKNNQNLAPLIDKIGIIVAGLVLDTAQSGGLIEAKTNYLSNKSLMVTNLTSNEKALRGITNEVDVIADFVALYSEKLAKEAEESVSSGRVMILSFSIGAIIAGIIITMIVVASIRKPLYKMVKTLQTMATGDLSPEIEISNKDEFGKLQNSANELNQSFKQMINSIQQQSHLIMDSVEQTRGVTLQARDAASEQRSQSTSVAVSMEEMIATIADISQSAQATSEKMMEVHDQAQLSQEQIEENRNKTLALQDEMNNTGQVITELDGYVNKIEEILQVIDAIAEQTNLLALNAAIEAARAGEQGRGFAVVADEVRTLAGRTRGATEEIKQNISTLLSGSKKAVTAIQLSQNKTSESVDMAEVIHQHISSIVTTVTDAKDLNIQIASAAEQQSCTSIEVN